MQSRHRLRQLLAITAMNLRTLPGRLGTAAVAVIGIGGVVAVLVAALSITEGFRAAMSLSGREDVAIVLRGGSSDELSSGLSVGLVISIVAVFLLLTANFQSIRLALVCVASVPAAVAEFRILRGASSLIAVFSASGQSFDSSNS